MDDETAATVLQLQLEDINDLLRDSSLGKQPPITTDARTALELYQGDLRDRENLFNDRRMARSMGRAVRTDYRMIAVNRRNELTCERDHSLALRMNGQAQSTPQAIATPPVPNNEAISEDLASYNHVRRIHPEAVFPIPHGSGEKPNANTSGSSHSTAEENSRLNALRDTHRENILSHITAGMDPIRDHAPLVLTRHLNETETDQRTLPRGSDSSKSSNKIHAHSHPEEPFTKSQVIDAQPRCAGCEDPFPQAEMLQASCEHYVHVGRSFAMPVEGHVEHCNTASAWAKLIITGLSTFSSPRSRLLNALIVNTVRGFGRSAQRKSPASVEFADITALPSSCGAVDATWPYAEIAQASPVR
ncbi:tyrosinase [Physcia stellaris]|nr:tyrosinase [Physcia stellaris]